MKIIKEGKTITKPKEDIKHIYRMICKECKCEFECNEEEVEVEEYTNEEMSLFAFGAGRNINIYQCKTVQCPCCKKTISLEHKLLNSTWKPWLG